MSTELTEGAGFVLIVNVPAIALVLDAQQPPAHAMQLIAIAVRPSKLSATEAQDLSELLEERSINTSTLFTTQLPLDHWSEVIADSVFADAIRDRLEHLALAIHITVESYRGGKMPDNLPARGKMANNHRMRFRQ